MANTTTTSTSTTSTSIKIISGSTDNCIKIWEIDNLNFGTWSVVATETFNKHTEPVTCLELLPNNRIASGSTDTSVLVWSLDKFQCVNEFLGHWGPVECLCAYGGNQVISGSSDKTIRVWDSELNECPRTLLGHTNGVTSLQIIEGHYLLSGAGLFSAIIWDLNTGNLLVHFKGQHCNINGTHKKLQTLCNDMLVFAENDFNIKMWDLKDEAEVMSFSQIIAEKKTYEKRILSYEDHSIKLYDLTKHFTKEKPTIDLILFAHTDVITSLKILANSCLASGSLDHTINIWNLKTGECIRTLLGHTGCVSMLELVNEETLASGSWDRTIRIWDLKSGECLKKLDGHTGHITCLKVVTDDELKFVY